MENAEGVRNGEIIGNAIVIVRKQAHATTISISVQPRYSYFLFKSVGVSFTKLVIESHVRRRTSVDKSRCHMLLFFFFFNYYM